MSLLLFAGCNKDSTSSVHNESINSDVINSEVSEDIENVESDEQTSSEEIQSSEIKPSSKPEKTYSSTQTKTESEEQKQYTPDTVSEYVKTTMDACEQATIEYVDYIKSISTLKDGWRYYEHDSLAESAAAALNKYRPFVSEQYKIKNMELSPADREYYNIVSERIDKKYSELTQED